MNNINAKVGQKWRCRNGNIATVIRQSPTSEAGYGFQTTGSGYGVGDLWHYLDGTQNVDSPEFDLISLVDEKEDKIQQAERELAEQIAKVEALEKNLAKLRKPAPIRHGDYGIWAGVDPRVFCAVEGKIAAFETSGRRTHEDANKFRADTSPDVYKILGNIFDDMAKKDANV